MRGFEIPEFNRTAKGIPIINMLQIEPDEWINTVITVRDFEKEGYLFFTTKAGISKRVALENFANIRRGGLIAITLRGDDELISVRTTDGEKDIVIATKKGYIIRFREDAVRAMGRVAAGVRGINLRDDDEVVSMEIVEADSYILHVTNKGIGKRTIESEYRRTNRGGKGYYTCRLTDDTGHVVKVKIVTGEEDLILMTIEGVLIRIPIDTIPITGRSTQGVRLIRIQEEEEVATVATIIEEDVVDAELVSEEDAEVLETEAETKEEAESLEEDENPSTEEE